MVGNNKYSDLRKLKNSITGQFEKNAKESVFTLGLTEGNGTIRKFELGEGIYVHSLNVTLNHTNEINLDFIENNTIQFIFCRKGSFVQQYTNGKENILEKIDQYQTAVCYFKDSSNASLEFFANHETHLSIISIDMHSNIDLFDSEYILEDNCNLQNIVSDIENKEFYVHKGVLDINIAKKFEMLEDADRTTDLCNELQQKGEYFIILAEEISKFCKEIIGSHNKSPLSDRELKVVMEISLEVKKHPEKEYRINTICTQNGLSPAKLQEGIKYMYNLTFADFVKGERLLTAEKLIKNTDLTISEIVYSVGLTSRSYFSKIFKKEFNCSPKGYRNRIGSRNLATTGF